MYNKLKELSESCFIGNINDTAEIVTRMIKPFVDEVYLDKSGGVIAKINGKNDYRIMLEAHIDEIGMIVTKVLSGGFVRVRNVGGVDIRVLPSLKVVIHGKTAVKGIFTSTPPHLASQNNDDKYPSFDDIMIDTGLENAEEIISVGDFVTFDTKFTQLNEDYVTGKSLDNRTGCLSLIRAAEMIHNNGTPENTIVFSFATAEELGNRGSKIASYDIDANEAIAVDVSFGLSPNAPKEHCGVLGDGAMIGVSPILSRAVKDKLISIAENNNIDYQLEIMGGRTSTDADVISITKSGVKTGLLSIPLRYMHTPVEVAKLSDIESVAMLLKEYALS